MTINDLYAIIKIAYKKESLIMVQEILKPKDVSKLLNVSTRTLVRWDESGKLKAKRTPTNRRYYTYEQINSILHPEDTNTIRKNVAYTRVSTRNQQDDLKNQQRYIESYVLSKGITINEYVTDVGSGLNYKRKNWNKLLDQVMDNQIDKIYITYQDRFIRFGFDWFQRFCNRFGTKIVVLNAKTTSPTKELTEDLISIIHVFSCRLYGLRKYDHAIKKDSTIKEKA